MGLTCLGFVGCYEVVFGRYVIGIVDVVNLNGQSEFTCSESGVCVSLCLSRPSIGGR